MEIFKGIDFNDSFVLDWSASKTEIVFKIEASIWPDPPHYSKPELDEYTYYCKSEIRFTEFTSYFGIADKSSVKPTRDIDGTFDYGNIDCLLITNQGFKVIGEFGVVEIMGGKVQFKVYP